MLFLGFSFLVSSWSSYAVITQVCHSVVVIQICYSNWTKTHFWIICSINFHIFTSKFLIKICSISLCMPYLISIKLLVLVQAGGQFSSSLWGFTSQLLSNNITGICSQTFLSMIILAVDLLCLSAVIALNATIPHMQLCPPPLHHHCQGPICGSLRGISDWLLLIGLYLYRSI